MRLIDIADRRVEGLSAFSGSAVLTYKANFLPFRSKSIRLTGFVTAQFSRTSSKRTSIHRRKVSTSLV